jgi:hypothetical protein
VNDTKNQSKNMASNSNVIGDSSTPVVTFESFDDVPLGDTLDGTGSLSLANGHNKMVEFQIEEKHDAKDEICGCNGFHPTFLQRFRTPVWMVFSFCLASFIQG